MVEQLPVGSGTPISGSHHFQFHVPLKRASMASVEGKFPQEIGMSYIKEDMKQQAVEKPWSTKTNIQQVPVH